MNNDEQRLADVLHRITPEPPRPVTVEQVAYRLVSEPRRGYQARGRQARGRDSRPRRGLSLSRAWAPALAAAWPRWSRLRRQDAPELYVRKIMVNTFLRWRQRRWNGEIATGRLPETQAYDVFAQVDARQSLLAALDRLPARQRAVVVLRYFADQTESQTAEAMGCSVGAVKSHASKALARLRDAPGLAEMMTGGVAS